MFVDENNRLTLMAYHCHLNYVYTNISTDIMKPSYQPWERVALVERLLLFLMDCFVLLVHLGSALLATVLSLPQ